MDLLFKVKSEEETEQVLKSKNASLLTESDLFLENYLKAEAKFVMPRCYNSHLR